MSWFYNRDERNYKLLNKKEKLSYKTHNRLDNKYTDQLNKKYSKKLEIKAIYHGLCCDEILKNQRKLTKNEKIKLFNESKDFVNKTS